jgi:hypothetical protein
MQCGGPLACFRLDIYFSSHLYSIAHRSHTVAPEIAAALQCGSRSACRARPDRG